MFVKSAERKKRSFKGVDFFIGAVGERMMVTLMTFKRDQKEMAHSHPHEQAGYCIQGRFILTIDGQSMEIGPDDSYVIPGGATHDYRVLEDSLSVEMFSPPREEYR